MQCKMGIPITKTGLLTFILVFWIVVYACFILVGESLVVPNGISSNGTVNYDNVNGFTLLLQVMFFSVPPSYNIPVIVSLILDVVAIASVYTIGGILLGRLIDAN